MRSIPLLVRVSAMKSEDKISPQKEEFRGRKAHVPREIDSRNDKTKCTLGTETIASHHR
jgi:hypothetical protein